MGDPTWWLQNKQSRVGASIILYFFRDTPAKASASVSILPIRWGAFMRVAGTGPAAGSKQILFRSHRAGHEKRSRQKHRNAVPHKPKAPAPDPTKPYNKDHTETYLPRSDDTQILEKGPLAAS